VYIPLPDEPARRTLIKISLGTKDHNLAEAEVAALAARTEGFSGSDISTLIRGEALMMPVKAAKEAWWFKFHHPQALGLPPGSKAKWSPVEPWLGYGGPQPSAEVVAWAQQHGLQLGSEGVMVPWGSCDNHFHIEDPRYQERAYDDVTERPPGRLCPACGAVKRCFAKLEAGCLLVSPVTLADCLKALARTRPTVSKKDLDEHEAYTREFGSDGS